jgi:hypothetical protein
VTLPDALGALLGFLLLVAGVAMYSVRAALIASGVLLLVGALWPKRTHTRKETVK